ncbi:hypothetical protein D3C81_1733630 [compost metagenome]
MQAWENGIHDEDSSNTVNSKQSEIEQRAVCHPTMELSVLRLAESREFSGNHHIDTYAHVDDKRPEPPWKVSIDMALKRQEIG